jgi:hypothetical protein
MMRSFFGEQEGAFSLSIESISAVCSGTEKEFAVVGVEEKRSVKAQSRDPIIYNNRSPPGFNATTLFCVGFCVVSAVILFAMSTSSSKKDVRNLYMKLRNGI